MKNEKRSYDCFYSYSGNLPETDDRLPEFQRQMIADGWDNTQLWSFDNTLFMFSRDKLEWLWIQSPSLKPDDKLLLKSINFNYKDSLVPKEQELVDYFWQWLEANVLSVNSDVDEYRVFRHAFFEFLKPRLIQFTKNAKDVLVKDGTYTDYFRMLDNTIDFVIPISLSGESENYTVNQKRYNRMLNDFVKSIPGLWI